MKAESDAMAHYFALMRRNAKNGSISRLGLARVRAEGEGLGVHVVFLSLIVVSSRSALP